jgi:hypothetical protein
MLQQAALWLSKIKLSYAFLELLDPHLQQAKRSNMDVEPTNHVLSLRYFTSIVNISATKACSEFSADRHLPSGLSTCSFNYDCVFIALLPK